MVQEKPRKLIAVAWLLLNYSPDYRLYKIFSTDLVDGAGESIAKKYDLEAVELENRPAAFRWIQESFWKDWGVWYNGRPGIVFTPDLIEVFRAIKSLSKVTQHALPYEVMIPAPVRFDWTEFHEGKNKHGMVRYRYIAPKRTRREMHNLRQKYPAAGDLAFLPDDIAAGRRDQNGTPTGIAPCHDWTVGWAW